MEIKQLEYFIEIVDCGTFSAAAEKIYVTQPALSRIVKKLEDELGTNLLYPQGKKTVPTDAGRILYLQAKKILHECKTPSICSKSSRAILPARCTSARPVRGIVCATSTG